MNARDYNQRFASIQRLYGVEAAAIIKSLHVCVIGLGGVGSWAVESLARSGVGRLTIIDYDVVREGNINRQLNALGNTIHRKKFEVLVERVAQINPDCVCTGIDDFVTLRNLDEHLSPAHGYDYVIDAIDRIHFKAGIIYHCKRNKIPIITTGGAGGLTDPTQIKVTDLTRTFNDPLAAKVRGRLRKEYGYTSNPKRYFGVECVFSTQHPVYPKEDGTVSAQKPGIHGISLDCRFGYGSASFVTAAFGLAAVSRVVNKTLAKRMKKTAPAHGAKTSQPETLAHESDPALQSAQDGPE